MPLRRPRHSICLVLLAVLSLLGLACSGPPTRDGGADIEEKPPIRAAAGDAQARFDEAVALLDEGRWDEAREAFQLVQAEFPDDPIAPLAELYAARALVGEIAMDADPAQADAGRLRQARQMLGPLAASDGVDDRIRWAAAVYDALAAAIAGRRQAAFDALSDYPGPTISPAVLDRDRLAARAVLAAALEANARPADAVAAYARLLAQVEDRLEAITGVVAGARPPAAAPVADDLAEPAQAPQPADVERDALVVPLRAVAHLAVSRSFGLAASLDEAQLQSLMTSELALAKAVGGWEMLRRELADAAELGAGAVDVEARASLERLYTDVAADLARVGAADRAAELSQQLAALGGPRRMVIGVLLPLSGPNAAIGQRAMAGALLAVRAFRTAGEPGATVVFLDANRPAAEVLDQLDRYGALAAVGPLQKKRGAAFARIAQERGLPLMTLTPEPVGVEVGPEARPFVFRNFIDAEEEARAAAAVAFDEIGDRRAAIVYPTVGYGQAMATAFREAFTARGGQIVAEIDYDRTSSDFGKVAGRLAGTDAQAVFVADTAGKVAELAAFFANENIWGLSADKKPPKKAKRHYVHYLGTSLWQDPMLVRQAASYVGGALVPAWFSPVFETAPVPAFVGQFEATFGRPPQNFEAFTYDSVSWLRDLIVEQGMHRREAIRDALLGGDRRQGVTGQVQFDSRGVAHRALRFVTPTAEGFVPTRFEYRTHPAPPVGVRPPSAGEPAEAAQPADEASETR